MKSRPKVYIAQRRMAPLARKMRRINDRKSDVSKEDFRTENKLGNWRWSTSGSGKRYE